MGWSVHDVKQASVWEFFAALQGYVEANSPKETSKLTEQQADELFDWIDRADSRGNQFTTQTYWLDGERLVPAGVVSFTPD